eukprot:365679-Chlamydomonas_euryale.AAC.36
MKNMHGFACVSTCMQVATLPSAYRQAGRDVDDSAVLALERIQDVSEMQNGAGCVRSSSMVVRHSAATHALLALPMDDLTLGCVSLRQWTMHLAFDLVNPAGAGRQRGAT